MISPPYDLFDRSQLYIGTSSFVMRLLFTNTSVHRRVAITSLIMAATTCIFLG
jgi:hypothetical protein